MPNWRDFVKPGKVMVFSVNWCPYCTEIADVLDMIEVEYEKVECNLSWDNGSIQRLKRESGWNTFPTVFIGETLVGGCNDVKSKINNDSLFAVLDREGIDYSK